MKQKRLGGLYAAAIFLLCALILFGNDLRHKVNNVFFTQIMHPFFLSGGWPIAG